MAGVLVAETAQWAAIEDAVADEDSSTTSSSSECSNEDELFQRGQHPRYLHPHGRSRWSAKKTPRSTPAKNGRKVVIAPQQPYEEDSFDDEREVCDDLVSLAASAVSSSATDDDRAAMSESDATTSAPLVKVEEDEEEPVKRAILSEHSPQFPVVNKKANRRKQKAADKQRTFIDQFGSVNFGDAGEDYHPLEIMAALPQHMQHKAKLAFKREMRRCRGRLHWSGDGPRDEEEGGDLDVSGESRSEESKNAAAWGLKGQSVGDLAVASADRTVREHTATLESTLQLLQSMLPVDRRDQDTWSIALELRTNCQALVGVVTELLPSVSSGALVVAALEQIEVLKLVENESNWWCE